MEDHILTCAQTLRPYSQAVEEKKIFAQEAKFQLPKKEANQRDHFTLKLIIIIVICSTTTPRYAVAYTLNYLNYYYLTIPCHSE